MFPCTSRCSCGSPTALLILVMVPAWAWAQAVTEKKPDPLERLRHPSSEADPEKLVQGITGIDNLGEALLLLSDWDSFYSSDGKTVPARAILTKRLDESIRKVFSGEDLAKKAALATVLGTMADQAMNTRRVFVDGPNNSLVRCINGFLPELIKQAGSPDAGVRLAVANSLGRFTFGTEAAVPAIAELMADKDAGVRRAAAEALVRQAREGGYTLVEALPGENPEDRYSNPRASLPSSPKVILAVALKGLKSDDSEVRRSSLSSIAEAARRVKQFLSDRQGIPLEAKGSAISPEVHDSMKALEAMIPAVAAVLKQESDDNIPACEAIEQLALLRLTVLRAQDKGDSTDPFRDPLKKALPGLAAVLGSRNVESRLAALYALEEFESEGRFISAEVAKALGDTDPDVRWAAARVLGRMAPAGDTEAVPALAKVVRDESVDVRITALAALERYGASAASEVKAIRQALSAKDAQTRLWATRALAAVGPKGREEVREGLSKALGDEEVRIRRLAAEGLIAFAPHDEPTTKALRKALTDSDDEVRRNASRALLVEKK